MGVFVGQDAILFQRKMAGLTTNSLLANIPGWKRRFLLKNGRLLLKVAVSCFPGTLNVSGEQCAFPFDLVTTKSAERPEGFYNHDVSTTSEQNPSGLNSF